MVYYHIITESDDSNLFLGNKGNTYRGDEMQLTLDCVAEVVEVFNRHEEIAKIQSSND